MASPSAERVGRTFAKFYYTTYPLAPAVVSGFYQDGSKLSPPQNGGFVDTQVTGNILMWKASLEKYMDIRAINKRMYIFGKLKAEIISVDTEASHNGGVVVVVIGRIVDEEENRCRSFTQTFFLAPKGPHYSVCNDIFKYVDDDHTQVPVESAATKKAYDATYTEMFDLTMGVIREKGALDFAKLNKSILQKQQQNLSTNVSVEGSIGQQTEPPTKTYGSVLTATPPVAASASASASFKSVSINKFKYDQGVATTNWMD